MKNPLGIAAPVQKKYFLSGPRLPFKKRYFPPDRSSRSKLHFTGCVIKKGMNKSPDREIFIPLFFTAAAGAPSAPAVASAAVFSVLMVTQLRELLPLRQLLPLRFFAPLVTPLRELFPPR
jgi:hypothetical protein